VTADLVLVGGTVFGVPATTPKPRTAVAIRGGRVEWVGDHREVSPLIGRKTEVIDTRHRLVLPGFCDAHVHPVIAGLQLMRCDLTAATSRADCLAMVRRHARANAGAAVIAGGGWTPVYFPGGRPHRAELDAAVPDRPVILLDADQHNAWVNTAALTAAAITRDTTDPPGGRIGRDQDGEPDGLLHERAAALAGRLIAPPSRQDLLTALTAGQRELRRNGVTAWQDALVGPYLGTPDPLPAYLSAASDGLIDWRVSGALWWDPGRDVSQIGELRHRRELAAAAGFRTPHIKVMQDGICENQTAAMLEPYTDGAGHHGCPALTADELAVVTEAAARHGFGVHFHAVGDRAVRDCLDAVEAARHHRGVRHQIAHVQVIHPVDLPRFRRLGVTATIQPLWAASVPQLTELVNPLLGPERVSRQYPFGTLHRLGTRLAAGSDWPVSSPNPIWGVHVAVTRTPATRSAPWITTGAPPFLPEQALPVSAILRAYTTGSAGVLGLGARAGLIAPGRPADLVVLDKDILTIAPAEIERASVMTTIIGGQVLAASG
jgi:predicted amidohydrolase YtcJ